MSDDNTMRETVRRARELMAFVSAKPDDWSERHNALIAAGLCNDELPALCDDNEQLRAKSARVTAERDEARAELLRRTAECDEVRARGRELRREVEALAVERDALREALATQAAAVRQLDVARTARHDADARDAETLRRRQQAPGDVLAEIAAVREEARMWNARATELEGERDALRAIVEGRPTAPTQEEIAAHPGQWLVYYAARFEDRQPARTRLLDRTRATAAAAARWPTAPSRWCPVRDGRPCAWPVVEVSRG